MGNDAKLEMCNVAELECAMLQNQNVLRCKTKMRNYVKLQYTTLATFESALRNNAN